MLNGTKRCVNLLSHCQLLTHLFKDAGLNMDYPLSQGLSQNEAQGVGYTITLGVNSWGTFQRKSRGAWTKRRVPSGPKTEMRTMEVTTAASPVTEATSPKATGCLGWALTAWDKRPTCVTMAGITWAQRNWHIDWFVYWAFYLLCLGW